MIRPGTAKPQHLLNRKGGADYRGTITSGRVVDSLPTLHRDMSHPQQMRNGVTAGSDTGAGVAVQGCLVSLSRFIE
jgi:hypothetical protein